MKNRMCSDLNFMVILLYVHRVIGKNPNKIYNCLLFSTTEFHNDVFFTAESCIKFCLRLIWAPSQLVDLVNRTSVHADGSGYSSAQFSKIFDNCANMPAMTALLIPSRFMKNNNRNCHNCPACVDKMHLGCQDCFYIGTTLN